MFTNKYAFPEGNLAAKYSAVCYSVYFVYFYLVKMTLSMDRAGRGTLGHFHGVTLGQCYFIPKISSKIKFLLNMNFNVDL